METIQSRRLLERGLQVTPLGSQTYSKSFRYLSGSTTPFYFDRGLGSHVWDVDGNEFIDFTLGLGAITLGYCNPEVNEAVKQQLEKGVSFSQATELEILLAEKLVQVIPCAEMVRFVKNGSDATAAAVRLARAFTGRDGVAVCGYHGMHDWYIGSTELSLGVPQTTADLTVSFRYNDFESLEQCYAESGNRLAAIVLEPVQGNGPRYGFLEKLRKFCSDNGVILVFDEVVSGFRIALGGAQEYYGVVPDLAAVGKGMANGFPLAAVVGSRDLLEQVSEGVFVSTTFGGETLSLAAALKTIEIMERERVFEELWLLSSELSGRCSGYLVEKGLQNCAKYEGVGPHGGIIFKKTESASSIDLLSLYQQNLLERGVYSLGINNFCLSHTDSDIELHSIAIGEALGVVAEALQAKSIKSEIKGRRIRPIFQRSKS